MDIVAKLLRKSTDYEIKGRLVLFLYPKLLAVSVSLTILMLIPVYITYGSIPGDLILSSVLWILLSFISPIVYFIYSYFRRRHFFKMAKSKESDSATFEEKKIKNLYDSGGSLQNWASATIQFNGDKYARHIWKSFINSDFFPNTEEPVILSPSAARGYYERNAFDFLREMQYEPYFVLSDVSNDDREKDVISGRSFFLYVPEKININGLQDKYELGQPPFHKKPHVIWDLKGGLWYAAYNEDNPKREILNLLKKYHNILAPNGVILIDAYHQNSLKTEINVCHFYALKRLRDGYAEKSTLSKLLRSFKSKRGKSGLAEAIGDLFEISTPFGEGNHRSVALIKK